MAPEIKRHRVLNKIYNDPSDSGSFGGVDRLWRSARAHPQLKRISRKAIVKFLKEQDAYTLHRPIRKRFTREPTIVKGIDDQWQADLADMTDLSRDNGGHRYMLTVIDCFTKFAWIVPVKRKDTKTMIEAFRSLLNQAAPRKPTRLQTDKGKEFINTGVQKFLSDNNIKHFSTESETKAAIVERFNRTIKSKIFTYFTAKNTRRYVDVLQQLVTAYNKTYHRSIGMRPIDVNKRNEARIWHRLYGAYAGQVRGSNSIRSKFKRSMIDPDATVRVSKSKTAFEKGYLPNWSTELFRVVSRRDQGKRPLYKIKDYAEEDIAGRFYPEELQSVRDNEVYPIEKVLQKRKRNGVTEIFVKWKGWPKKFNSWIPETDAEDISQR